VFCVLGYNQAQQKADKLLHHLMRLEIEFISLKQDVMLSGLTKAHWNLTWILSVLENFWKVEKSFSIYRWLKGTIGQG
jgi:hypothetical protein